MDEGWSDGHIDLAPQTQKYPFYVFDMPVQQILVHRRGGPCARPAARAPNLKLTLTPMGRSLYTSWGDGVR